LRLLSPPSLCRRVSWPRLEPRTNRAVRDRYPCRGPYRLLRSKLAVEAASRSVPMDRPAIRPADSTFVVSQAGGAVHEACQPLRIERSVGRRGCETVLRL